MVGVFGGSLYLAVIGMAAVTLFWCAFKDSGSVAIFTTCPLMCTCELKACLHVVKHVDRQPASGQEMGRSQSKRSREK